MNNHSDTAFVPAPLLQFNSNLVVQFHDYIPTIIFDLQMYSIRNLGNTLETWTDVNQSAYHYTRAVSHALLDRMDIYKCTIKFKNSVVPVSPTVLLDQHFFKSTELSLVSWSII